MSRSILWSVRLGLLWLLGACAALPDVTPFEAATRDLAAAVKVAGETAVDQIRQLQKVEKATANEGVAEKHRAAWDKIDAAMSAFVRYAASLQDLAASANQGRESAEALVGKVADVATSLGWTDPKGVVDLVSTAAAFIWAQIGLARSAATMEEAMTTLQPAVERMVLELGKILDENLTASEFAALARKGLLEGDPAYVAARDAREKAIKAQTTLFTKVAESQSSRTAAIITDDANRKEMDGLKALLQAANEIVAPVEAKMARIDEDLTQLGVLTVASKLALSSWATTHSQLNAAIKARRAVDTSALIEAVVELRGLVRRIKDL